MTARRRAARDAGLSLAELVVVMLVGGMLLVLVASLTAGLTRGNAANLARQQQVDEARTAVTWLSRALGQAVAPRELSDDMSGDVPLVFAAGHRLEFFTHLDDRGGDATTSAGPARVAFDVTDGVLRRTIQYPDPGSTLARWTYDCTPADCPENHEVLAVARGVDPALFRYVAADGSALPVPDPTTGLTAAQLAEVAAIEVRVVVGLDAAGEARPTTVLRRVSLPDWKRF